MRILFVCSASVWGGNEKWTSMAISQLIKNNEIFFCCKNQNLSGKFGTGFYRFNAPFRNYIDFFTFCKLFNFVQKYNIDMRLFNTTLKKW